MSSIKIQKIGITKLDTDAVVNAANEGLWEGGGVCGAIFDAAGSAELAPACNAIGGCKTGNAVITPGFKLKAKYIIHAVGPRWTDGNHNESKLLYSAYKQSLLLAKENGLHSIGFPLISAGIFGYPLDGAWRKAIQACNDFIQNNLDYDINIIFAVLDDKILSVGEKTLKDIVKDDKIGDNVTCDESQNKSATTVYDKLTEYLPKLEEVEFGEWVVDKENDGTPEHPIQIPYVEYDRLVNSFVKNVYQFLEEHKDMELNRYGEILEKSGLEWNANSMKNADINSIDGKTVMALIIGAIRADRFSEGTLLDFFKTGYIKKWLQRLKEIDEMNA